MSAVFSDPFQYELPAGRIAQRPVHPYHLARLLLVDRSRGVTGESTYWDSANTLRAGDVLVFNDSRVIPARIKGRLDGREVEVLLLRKEDSTGSAERWICTGKPLKRMRSGASIDVGCPALNVVVGERLSEREVVIAFESVDSAVRVPEALHSVGWMPIPPYIRGGQSDEEDRVDYQTFFSRVEGSIAAPTASLHFTPELFDRIRARGCGIEFVTLHVGAASFVPVWLNGKLSPPGTEYLRFDPSLLRRLQEVRANGGRVIAVGTTVVRALEAMSEVYGARDEGMLATALFIRPGYRFKAVDGLITNFHQPGTTHLLLVEAFVKGRDVLAAVYDYALANGFRFLSYGDGMLIV